MVQTEAAARCASGIG